MVDSQDISCIDASTLAGNDEDVALGHKIFACRPTGNTSLMPKGGLKYSDNNDTEEEASRLHSYYNARETALSSLKVRKLSNLGLAEWMPDHFVAKILQQGKFMQTLGFPHENGFLALYPEEALFLLDVGDIELKYKEALLSLQDAFSLLISVDRGGNLCTFDEYCVYAHLCRMGYRVQRYSESEIDDQDLPDCENNNQHNILDKRKASPSVDETIDSNIAKKSKLDDSDTELTPFLSERDQICDDNTPQDGTESRGWWLTNDEKKIANFSHDNSHSSLLCRVDIPNLGLSQTPVVLQEIENSLLPKNTCSRQLKLESIWYERLKKDDHISNQRMIYSFPKYLNYNESCRCATDWPNYKSLARLASKNRTTEMNYLCEKMHSGDVKPLIHPGTAKNLDTIYNNLQIFKKVEGREKQLTHKTFDIRFNVFMTESNKPFRKTNPGKPLVRVSVAIPSDPLPNFADTTNLSARSGGVPVKIAMVNSGRVLFLGFDDIDIPSDRILR